MRFKRAISRLLICDEASGSLVLTRRAKLALVLYIAACGVVVLVVLTLANGHAPVQATLL